MIWNWTPGRCEKHGARLCWECRVELGERAYQAQKSINQAMHDLCVWMLCQGCTDFVDAIDCVYQGGVYENGPIWQVNGKVVAK